LTTTSTGTKDAARVEARRVSAGEFGFVALLFSAQYPAVRFPGPRTTTWPGIRLLMPGGSVQPDPSDLLLKLPYTSRPTPRYPSPRPLVLEFRAE